VAFAGMRGVSGRVFVPRRNKAQKKKHACRDCYECQMCSDDRCSVCLKGKSKERAAHGGRRA